MKKQKMIIILVIVFALSASFYFMFPWNWSRWNPVWTIKSSEEIQDIKFTVTEKDQDSATAVVYLKVNGNYKKLPSKEVMTINSRPAGAEYYNNGVAVGYKYLLDLPKAEQYVLILKREGQSEITKTATLHE